MRTNPYRTYVEDEILTADPVRLIQLLYRGASEAVATARAELANGDIKARSAAVTKAIEILAELSSSLNHERGGEISLRLAGLYDYMQRRLIDANQEQADPPLAEVENILRTLEEAWLNVQAPTEAPNGENLQRSAHTEEAHKMVSSEYVPADYVPVSCAY